MHLVRMLWSGVAGPRVAMAATSGLRQNARLAASAWRDTTTGKPATSAIAFRSVAMSRDESPLSCLRRHGNLPRLLALQVRLGAIDQRDHPFIGLLRRRAEGEDAVVHQHHADGVRARLLRELLSAQPREVEAGHHVGNHDHEVAVDLADAAFAIRRVGDRQHRIGVGVIDVLVWQDRVQDRFHRGRGRGGARGVRGHLVDHLRVGKRWQLREALQVREPHRRKARLLDRLQVPAAALHVEQLLHLAQDVLLRHLDRCVAAAVQHQRLVAPQQPGRVAAHAEVAPACRRVLVVPEALHPALLTVTGSALSAALPERTSIAMSSATSL